MDEVERWKIRWDLVDEKPERLLDTLHATNWLIPGYIHHHQYHTDNVGVIGNKRDIFQCNKTRQILLKVDYWRWTTVQLITYAHIQTCTCRLEYDYWWLSYMYCVIPFGIKVSKGIKLRDHPSVRERSVLVVKDVKVLPQSVVTLSKREKIIWIACC